jgi:hypothetical protein
MVPVEKQGEDEREEFSRIQNRFAKIIVARITDDLSAEHHPRRKPAGE